MLLISNSRKDDLCQDENLSCRVSEPRKVPKGQFYSVLRKSFRPEHVHKL